MTIGLGTNDCSDVCDTCTPPPDCAACSDASVVFIAALSGIVDGTAVADPPGLGDCAVCEDLNVDYPLEYVGTSSVPTTCISLTDPPASGEGCEYGYRETCLETEGLDSFGRIVDARLWIYLSTGGDIRGYFQFSIQSTLIFFAGPGSDAKLFEIAEDFLIAAGVSSTPCLDIDYTGNTFTTCRDEGTSGFDCQMPTEFHIHAEPA